MNLHNIRKIDGAYLLSINNKNLQQSIRMTQQIDALVKIMLDFQNKNCITSQCVENCIFLLKFFPNENLKARSCFVEYYDEQLKDVAINMGHIVLTKGDMIIEPSYEIHRQKEKKYFFNIKDLIENGVVFNLYVRKSRERHNELLEIINDKKSQKIIRDGVEKETKRFIHSHMKEYLEYVEIENVLNKGEGQNYITSMRYRTLQTEYVRKNIR